jgi:hypothetical protein
LADIRAMARKTVIPAEATAKLTFRLVPGQDPGKIVQNFERFVTERLHPDARAEFKHFGAAPGFAMSLDAPFMRAAQAALSAEFGKPAALIGCGGSIPVVESVQNPSWPGHACWRALVWMMTASTRRMKNSIWPAFIAAPAPMPDCLPPSALSR